MVKVDLITGFLGSGKTTFIQHYIEFLKRKHETIHIIENEFGATSIDTHLIKNEVTSECRVSDLSGMCMCCVGKRAFIQMLIESSQKGIDRIIVEPSGIYDVDEFFDVLSDERVSQFCEIGMIVTIVDPLQNQELSDEVKYLMFTQLIASGTVVMSKTQFADKETMDKSIQEINHLLSDKGYDADISEDLMTKCWDELTDSDFELLQDSEYRRLVHEQEIFLHSEIFRAVERTPQFKNKEDIETKIKAAFENKEAGTIFRIKGFVKTLENKYYEVNSTGNFYSIEPTNVELNKLVIIGQRLKDKYIDL